MATMNTGSLTQLLSKDMDNWFFDEFSRHQPEYTQIANIHNGDGYYWREGEGAGLTRLQRMGEGEAVPQERFIQGNTKTVFYQNFGLAVQITKNMYEDEQQNVMRQATQELSKAAAYTKELEFFDIFNSGFTDDRVGLDGKELFADDHPIFGTGEEMSNLVTGALSKTNLEVMMDHFEEMENDKGIPVQMRPKVLLIPPKLKWKMKELMLSEYDPESANNTVNSVYGEGLSYMIGHYLTSDSAYFMLTEKQAHDLRFMQRRNLKTRMWDDPNTENALFAASMRFTVEFFRWRGVIGSTGV